MIKQLVFVLLLINLSTSSVFARVPPRNSAAEETAADAAKADTPAESNPVEKTPVGETNDEDSPMVDRPRKPIGVILFRTQPQISIFRDRSPFGPGFGSEPQLFPGLHTPHFGLRNGFSHDDPAIRLLSILFGDRRLRPLGGPIESGESEPVNASSDSSAESTESDRAHSFEGLFPSIFVPRFPLAETEKEGEPTTNNEEKTPANFENKEKKVILIGDRKYVKTTQTKKVKNDFGEFHSVISSYQPWNEKVHDENGNEKNPEESGVVEKKEVSPTTSAKPSESTTAEPAEPVPSSTEAPAVEKDETPDLKVKADEPDEKKAENLSKADESKNEISDKAEIKVDQMN